MPQSILSSVPEGWFEVQTSQQAKLLSDPVALQLLKPFMGRTLGVAQAARESGVSTARLAYRVKQFLDAGLLQRQGTRERQGRAIQLYRAPERLRLAFHLTPFADLEAQIARHSRPFDALRHRAAARSLHRLALKARQIYRDRDSGQVRSETHLPDPRLRQQVIGTDFTGTLWLTAQQAREVQTTLDELFARLGQVQVPPTPGRRDGLTPYLIQAALFEIEPAEAVSHADAP